MRFSQRTAADTTPESIVDRLFDAEGKPAKDAALAALRGANPGIVGAAVDAGVGSLLLLPPARPELPPLRDDVPSIASAGRLEIAILERALDDAAAALDAAELRLDENLQPMAALFAFQGVPDSGRGVFGQTASDLQSSASTLLSEGNKEIQQFRTAIDKLRADFRRLVKEL